MNIPYVFFARVQKPIQTHAVRSQRYGDACTVYTWKHVVFESVLMVYRRRRRRGRRRRRRWDSGTHASQTLRQTASWTLFISKRTISIVHTTRFREQRAEKPHIYVGWNQHGDGLSSSSTSSLSKIHRNIIYENHKSGMFVNNSTNHHGTTLVHSALASPNKMNIRKRMVWSEYAEFYVVCNVHIAGLVQCN